MKLKYTAAIILVLAVLGGLAFIALSPEQIFFGNILAISSFFVLGLSAAYLLYREKQPVWAMLMFFFSASLIHSTYLFFSFQSQASFVYLMLTSIIGFVYSVDSIPKQSTPAKLKNVPDTLPELPSLDEPEIIVEKLLPSEDTEKEQEQKQPESYVASRKGTKYHAAECRWALKILSKRRISFQSAKEAQDEGLKPCTCVQFSS